MSHDIYFKAGAIPADNKKHLTAWWLPDWCTPKIAQVSHMAHTGWFAQSFKQINGDTNDHMRSTLSKWRTTECVVFNLDCSTPKLLVKPQFSQPQAVSIPRAADI